MHALFVALMAMQLPLAASGAGSVPESAASPSRRHGSPRDPIPDPSQDPLQRMVGGPVVLRARDGRVLRALLVAVRPDAVRVRLANGAEAWVPFSVLAEVRSAEAGEGGAASPEGAPERAPGAGSPPDEDDSHLQGRADAGPEWPPDLPAPQARGSGSLPRGALPPPPPGAIHPEGCPNLALRARRPARRGYQEQRSFWVEWMALRGLAGFVKPDFLWGSGTFGAVAAGELVLFTLHWRWFYVEALRGGGGLGVLAYWGTGFGVPIRLGPSGRHELRLGAHLTFLGGYAPILSGAFVGYYYRFSEHFALQVGLTQYSYPTGVAFTFGFSV